MFQPLPWTAFKDDPTHFWVHYGFVILAFVLALVTAIGQWVTPAPYGKHEREDANWGFHVPQRLGHMFSDGVPTILFVLVFFLYGTERGAINYTFLALFLAHYIHRGFIHPLITRYSKPTVAIGITLGGFVPNLVYFFVNADWIGSAKYASNYYYDPRFLLGLVLYIVGYIINRWSDWKLRSLRNNPGEESASMSAGSRGYYIPRGGFFNLVTCPNYFGELVEWTGWALATWSLAGLSWCLFTAATFVPRARHNHKWYQEQFEHYPRNRKALIPFIF